MFGFHFWVILVVLNFSWLFMDSSSNAGCDSDERVYLPTCCSKCLYEWIVYSGLFIVGGVWKFVTTIGDCYELYDIWWGWHSRRGGGAAQGPLEFIICLVCPWPSMCMGERSTCIGVTMVRL